MARTEVSSVIHDILNAFQDGLHIFKTKSRKHRRRHTEPANTNEEKRIHDSLAQRPHEIKQTYEKSVAKHGHRFEVGDSTAQVSLAQTLLVLNTGLIKLLNHALSNDKSRSQSRSGVLNLSETAALDTLTALSELDLRMTSASSLNLKLSPKGRGADPEHRRKLRPRGQYSSQQSIRPAPSPLAPHGGWVRRKTDPSVVSVVVSPRAKRSDQKRTSASRSSSAARTKTSKSIPPVPETKHREKRSPPPSYSQLANESPLEPKLTPRGRLDHVQPCQPTSENKAGNEEPAMRHPGTYIAPIDFYSMFPQPAIDRYESQLQGNMHVLPSRPPKIPFHSRPQQQQQQQQYSQPVLTSDRFEGRIRPASMMTFMTASTKIGEIPEHRLPDRVLTEEQQEETPMPYVLPDMLDPPKKRGGRGFKFWKKEKPERDAVGPVDA